MGRWLLLVETKWGNGYETDKFYYGSRKEMREANQSFINHKDWIVTDTLMIDMGKANV